MSPLWGDYFFMDVYFVLTLFHLYEVVVNLNLVNQLNLTLAEDKPYM